MQSKLWQSYRAGNESARTMLLEEHLGLVHHVAHQISRTIGARADFDELVSAGTIGLMAALEGFDLSRGLTFSTFAAPRIRGAILDELRKQDHVPRSIRRKTRDLSAGREAFQRTNGRAPDDRELAAHELVKVRLSELKDQRHEVGERLARETGSHLVTVIGHVVVLYRAKPAANPAIGPIQELRGAAAAPAPAVEGVPVCATCAEGALS